MDIILPTLLEHGLLAAVLWAIIQFVLVPMITRLMDRLDLLTDRLLQIAIKQEEIIDIQKAIATRQNIQLDRDREP